MRRTEKNSLERPSLSKWESTYHVVPIPKRRMDSVRGAEASFGRGAPETGGAEGEPDTGGHLMADHVHTLVSIPPKHARPQVIGFVKGKRTIH
jgi:putative transposase